MAILDMPYAGVRTKARALALLLGVILVSLLAVQAPAHAAHPVPAAPRGYTYDMSSCWTQRSADNFQRIHPFWKLIDTGVGTGEFSYCHGTNNSDEPVSVWAQYKPNRDANCVDFRYPYRVIDTTGVHLYTIELNDRPCANGTKVRFDRDTADYRTYKPAGIKLDIAGDGGGANCMSSRTSHEINRDDWIEGRCSYKISTTNAVTYTFSAGGGWGGIVEASGGAEVTLGPEIQYVYHSIKFTPNGCVYISGVADGNAKCWR
jgi:hypothetical protein